MEGPGRRPALDLCVLLVEAAPAFQPNVLDEFGQGHAGLRLSTEIFENFQKIVILRPASIIFIVFGFVLGVGMIDFKQNLYSGKR